MSVKNENGRVVIAWNPSKKALDIGFPTGVDPYTAYNMSWDEIPEVSRQVGMDRTVRHVYNNEGASAKLAAESAAEKKGEEFDLVEFLHEYRLEKRAEMLEGRMGMRQPSAAEPVLSELDREIQDRAFETVRDFINYKGGSCNYQRRDARSLAWKNPQGETMQQLIDLLLTKKKGKQIIAEAEETVRKRQEDRAAAAEAEEDIFSDAAD